VGKLIHHRLAAIVLLCLLMFGTFGCGGHHEGETSLLPTAALQSMLDAKVAGSTAVPGALLAVARGGDGWVGVAGEADRATHDAVEPNLRFRVGSLTKQFTAALILKLAEEGRLSLDDTLRQWLPGLEIPYDDRITIRMLLNHTSGVPDYATTTFWNDLIFPDSERAWQPVDMVELAKAGTSTEPGTAFSYCNTGYVLAGMIAEAAAQESASDAMARRFFIPLGMHDTELAADGTFRRSHAHGYLRLPGSRSVDDVSTWNPSSAWTAGAMVTTAHDMLVWADALFGGRVLSPGSLDAMLTPVAPSTTYGFGLGLQKAADGRTFIFHSGLIPGYYAIIAHHRASGLTILVLTNREDISEETNDVAGPILDAAMELLP
jgi:D-alanyl-D-alanine carboxypeptidase